VIQDARLYQILFLALFLALGIGTRDWTLHPEVVLVAIATCLLTQAVALHWLAKITPQFALSESVWITYRSPLITALGLSLLLRTEHPGIMAIAAVAAIASKFLLRIHQKHVFNPANFGIVTVLLLTGQSWVSPGQWGEESWYVLLFLGAGGLVLGKVGRWDTSVAFLGSYALLEAARNLYLGWTWDVWLHRLTSGSLLLFALFMITDPRTIPNARGARIFWAGAIALLTFILRNSFFLSTGVFWALFVLAPLTPLLDYLWQAPRFSWLITPAEPKPSPHLPSVSLVPTND